MIVQLVTVVSRRVTKDMYSKAQTEQRRNLRLLLLFHFPHTSGGHPKDSRKLPITSPAFFFLSDCLGLGLCYFASCLAFLTPLFFPLHLSFLSLGEQSRLCVVTSKYSPISSHFLNQHNQSPRSPAGTRGLSLG